MQTVSIWDLPPGGASLCCSRCSFIASRHPNTTEQLKFFAVQCSVVLELLLVRLRVQRMFPSVFGRRTRFQNRTTKQPQGPMHIGVVCVLMEHPPPPPTVNSDGTPPSPTHTRRKLKHTEARPQPLNHGCGTRCQSVALGRFCESGPNNCPTVTCQKYFPPSQEMWTMSS